MKRIAFVFLLIFASFSQAEKGININILKELSINEIHKEFPEASGNDFVFVDMDVNTKTKKLNQSFIELGFVDKNSLHSDEYSKYSYDRYIVSFNIVTGALEKLAKGGWGSYKSVDEDVIE